MSETKNPWQVMGAKMVYDNKWIRVTEYDVMNPGGGAGIYGKVHFKNLAIGVIVLDDAMNTWLVGQYRFVLDEYTWEIPEGGCPGGEDFLEAAKRELVEETGLAAQSWQEIARVHLSNSVSDEYGILFLAKQLSQGTASPEETEELKIKKVPFAEALAMVNRGEITDSLSVIAIQKIQLMILTGAL